MKLHKRDRKQCRHCRCHAALFSRRGRVKWDRMHTLCFRCWRSVRDRCFSAFL